MEDLKESLSKHFGYIVGFTLVLLASASLLMFAQFIGELKTLKFVGQGIPFQNTITVSGRGEVLAAPDVAEFSFAVIEEAKTVALAQDMVTKKMNNLLELLKKSRVEEKDIKTTNYNIVPRYEYSDDTQFRTPSGQRTLMGYEVSHWVSVKVRKTENAGAILSQMGGGGATNISGLNFTIDNEDALKGEARKKAIEDAGKKASSLADDLGVNIIKIVSFNESGGPIFYKSFVAAEALDMGGAPATPEIPSGENTITSDVTITYAID